MRGCNHMELDQLDCTMTLCGISICPLQIVLKPVKDLYHENDGGLKKLSQEVA